MQRFKRTIINKSGEKKKRKLELYLPDYLRDSSLDKYNRIEENQIPIPTCWNVNDCSKGLKLNDDLLTVGYVGHIGNGRAAAIRSNYCISKETGIYYFEIDILEGGEGNLISIGVATPHFSLRRHVGWDPGSIGYHGDDGLKFLERGYGLEYGPTYSTGDTIGCCVNFFSDKVFFTKNGINLGYASSSYNLERLYPAVGMRCKNARVEANFGNRPFKFDIKLYAKTLIY